jgi:hypothetical protein
MSTRLKLGLAWALSCVIAGAAGWFGHSHLQRVQKTGDDADVVRLPEYREAVVQDSNGKLLLNVNTGAQPGILTGLNAYSKEKPVFYTRHFDDGGVKEVGVIHRGRSRREWLGGRGKHHGPGETVTRESTATKVAIPRKHMVALTAEDGSEPIVVITRRAPDLTVITGVAVVPSGDAAAYFSFFKDTGAVSSIRVKHDNGDELEWGFRKNGSVDFGPVLDKEKLKRGNRQYYDRDGKPTRIESFVIHN